MKTIWDGRENNFDFIRLALAVLVIYSHSFPLGVGSEAGEPFARWTHGQATGGSVAVNLFFIMSGFLITASAERSPSLNNFLKKRVLRIYPGFIVAMLFSACVVLPVALGHFVHSSAVSRVADFAWQSTRLLEFGYAGAFPHNPYPGAINGSVWSIPYEFWCYVGVALLAACGVLRRRWTVLVLFVAALVVSILFQVNGWVLGGKILGRIFGFPGLWARLLPLYLAGMVFYLYRESIQKKAAWVVVAVLALAGAVYVPWGWTAVFPLAAPYLVFYLAFTPVGSMHRFGRFGDFSYGAYLYAFPVEQMLMQWFGRPVAPHVLFWSATPLTLGLAAASWYGVERWFLPRARQKHTPAELLQS